jgi:hypothetical protein
MNPLTWRHEHQLARCGGGGRGCSWPCYRVMYHHMQFETLRPWRWSWSSFRWGYLGAIIGAATLYIRKLVHA